MIVYISGPVTGVADYKKNFIWAKKKLEQMGYETYSILDMDFLGSENFSWSDCMKFALSLLEKADSLYLLDGWEESVGATIEKMWAEKIGMSIFNKF